MKLTVFISALFFVLSAFAGNEAPWSFDLKSTEGTLRGVHSMVERHGLAFTDANSHYIRSPMKVMQEGLPLLQEIAGSDGVIKVGPAHVLGAQFSTSDLVVYDEVKIGLIREGLIADVGRFPLSDLTDISNDLHRLKTLVSSGVGGEEAAKKFTKDLNSALRVLPFLYDGDGNAIFKVLDAKAKTAVSQEISKTSANGFSGVYLDRFSRDQAPFILGAAEEKGFGQIRVAFESAKQQFVQRNLLPAIRAIPKVGSELRSISLEEVPPAFAFLRGNYGGDCSVWSVTYYPTVPGTKTYWIRKKLGFDTAPDGYAFVAPVRANGKTLPMILTVNGVSLTGNDTEMIFEMIAKDWNTNAYLLPTGEAENRTYNFKESLNRVTSLKGRVVATEFPEGWEAIDEYQTRKVKVTYYTAKSHSKAKLVEVKGRFPVTKTIAEESLDLYKAPSKSVKSMRTIERVNFFDAMAVGAKTKKELVPLKEELNIDPKLSKEREKLLEFAGQLKVIRRADGTVQMGDQEFAKGYEHFKQTLEVTPQDFERYLSSEDYMALLSRLTPGGVREQGQLDPLLVKKVKVVEQRIKETIKRLSTETEVTSHERDVLAKTNFEDVRSYLDLSEVYVDPSFVESVLKPAALSPDIHLSLSTLSALSAVPDRVGVEWLSQKNLSWFLKWTPEERPFFAQAHLGNGEIDYFVKKAIGHESAYFKAYLKKADSVLKAIDKLGSPFYQRLSNTESIAMMHLFARSGQKKYRPFIEKVAELPWLKAEADAALQLLDQWKCRKNLEKPQ